MRILDMGRCRLENRDRLYIVLEYAEENLSQILPLRPLTAAEGRETLEPLLDVLVYLHSKGLVHSRIKPSNILATADQLKLSSDTLFPIGESRKSSGKFDAHDAPETAASPLSAAADVWSLGSPWSKHSRSAYLSCSPEIKPTQSSPTRFPSRSSMLRVTHSAAIHGAAGALLKSPRASIPWPSALPPLSPFLR